MDEELVEKVARAICFERVGRVYDCRAGCTPDTGCIGADHYLDVERNYARAAIQAMMEAGWKSAEDVEDALLNEAESLRSHMREYGD